MHARACLYVCVRTRAQTQNRVVPLFLCPDVVSSFVRSAKKGGVGFGFYYSVVSNQLCNVCQGKVQPNPAKGQLAVTQEEYDALVLEQLTELWGDYGPLEEVGALRYQQLNSAASLGAPQRSCLAAFRCGSTAATLRRSRPT
jgi:hypothetical protein